MLECHVIIFVDTVLLLFVTHLYSSYKYAIKTFLVLNFEIIYFTISSWGSGFMCSM